MQSVRSVPPHLEELFPRSQIMLRIGEMAREMDDWAEESLSLTRQSLLAVCVLRGGVFFFSDLLLAMTRSVEPGFLRAWSYRKDGNEAPEKTLRLEWLGLNLEGRDVVIVDNICDSGRTLQQALLEARAAKPHSVRTVTMVYREREQPGHRPTLTGFGYGGAEWLVGYGLRDRGALMNYPSVYRMKTSGG